MSSKLQRLREQGKPINLAPSPALNSNWQQKFIDYLRSECHLADNTVQAYGRDIKRLMSWLSGRPVNRLRLADLSEFVASLQNEKLAPASISRTIVATRMFFKYLQLEGIVQDNPSELLSTQRMWQRIPKAITPAAVERCLAAPRKFDI